MSPNEFQLRAALRDGEGEAIDPDTVIARARATTQARHDRRVRLGSIAAAVVAVGGIGVAAGVVLNGGNDHTTSANSERSAAQDQANGKGGAVPNAQVPIAPGPMSAADAVQCPASAPALKTPAGPGQGAAAGSLFSGPVEAIKICAYQQTSGAPVPGSDGQPLNTTLLGSQATDLAASLDAASKLNPQTPCPLYVTTNGKKLVMIGVSTSGEPMDPVVAIVSQNPCNLPVTNGTAVRFNWAPPRSLAKFLVRLQPVNNGPITVPSRKVTGSPVRS